MRIAWCSLIVLVLLAPLGQVGITATPAESEVVTMPTRAANVRATERRAERQGRVVVAARAAAPVRRARAAPPRPRPRLTPAVVVAARRASSPRAPPAA